LKKNQNMRQLKWSGAIQEWNIYWFSGLTADHQNCRTIKPLGVLPLFNSLSSSFVFSFSYCPFFALLAVSYFPSRFLLECRAMCYVILWSVAAAISRATN
jgi:hypothetical protein